MNPELLLALRPYILGLAILIVALLLFWIARRDLGPICSSVVIGLASHAQKNATAYAFGFLLASAASLQSLAQESAALGWVYVAAACKILQPGLVAVIAFVRPSTPQPPKPTGSTTTPPFSSATNP